MSGVGLGRERGAGGAQWGLLLFLGCQSLMSGIAWKDNT